MYVNCLTRYLVFSTYLIAFNKSINSYGCASRLVIPFSIILGNKLPKNLVTSNNRHQFSSQICRSAGVSAGLPMFSCVSGGQLSGWLILHGLSWNGQGSLPLPPYLSSLFWDKQAHIWVCPCHGDCREEESTWKRAKPFEVQTQNGASSFLLPSAGQSKSQGQLRFKGKGQ